MRQANCSVIIISYNNADHLKKNLSCLNEQTIRPKQIIIVDTGSQDRNYLNAYASKPNIEVILAEPGCGFCVGNNLGYQSVAPDANYVFLLNPDAFLTPAYIEEAITFMEKKENKAVGAVTGLTLGYDFEKDSPTGRIDTTGIFPTWYGKWMDRGQGQKESPKACMLPAICGAVFFCRKAALESALTKEGEVFDSRYYMYKEDIDLSLRLQKKGWSLHYLPELVAYHCRGWNSNRRAMPRKYRLFSAYNECRINFKRGHPVGCLYSLAKYFAVRVFDL